MDIASHVREPGQDLMGVNANGQTYGVSNQQGTPDLIAVVVDQGKTQGYVEQRELNCASAVT